LAPISVVSSTSTPSKRVTITTINNNDSSIESSLDSDSDDSRGGLTLDTDFDCV